MFNIALDFVKNPYFVGRVVEIANFFEEEIADEFTFELIQDLEVTYDFYKSF